VRPITFITIANFTAESCNFQNKPWSQQNPVNLLSTKKDSHINKLTKLGIVAQHILNHGSPVEFLVLLQDAVSQEKNCL
jgi:hypothetical protein